MYSITLLEVHIYGYIYNMGKFTLLYLPPYKKTTTYYDLTQSKISGG